MTKPTLREARSIEAESLADARTIRRYFSGAPIRAVSRARIEEALDKLGLQHLRPVNDDTTPHRAA